MKKKKEGGTQNRKKKRKLHKVKRNKLDFMCGLDRFFFEMNKMKLLNEINNKSLKKQNADSLPPPNSETHPIN